MLVKSFQFKAIAFASLTLLLAACQTRPSSENTTSVDQSSSETSGDSTTTSSSSASIDPTAPKIVNWYNLPQDTVRYKHPCYHYFLAPDGRKQSSHCSNLDSRV
jgi:hypothetical protein